MPPALSDRRNTLRPSSRAKKRCPGRVATPLSATAPVLMRGQLQRQVVFDPAQIESSANDFPDVV